MRITTTSPFFQITMLVYIHMLWKWILFAGFISLSLAHQLLVRRRLKCILYIASDEQRTCATWSLSISSSSTHSLQFTPSQQQQTPLQLILLYMPCLCIWIDSLYTFVKKTYQRTVSESCNEFSFHNLFHIAYYPRHLYTFRMRLCCHSHSQSGCLNWNAFCMLPFHGDEPFSSFHLVSFQLVLSS